MSEDSEDSGAIIGRVLQDTYRIERQIGQGTMGAVYEAAHLRLARRFAIKVLHPSIAHVPEAFARLRTEAEAASAIGHPNILEVVDFNQMPDGTPYIVMELLKGESLESRIQRVGQLSLPQALTIFGEAAAALQAAHEKDVVHRDLKPQNIHLCPWSQRDDFVKVLDFGLSKIRGSSMTRANVLLGSPSYMSPEQARGRSAEVDRRADVYAMGVILFEMLAGEPLFIGHSIPDVLQKIVRDPPRSIRSIRPDVPQAVEEVIGRALAKEREERYETMEAFWVAFARVLEHEGFKESHPALFDSLPPVTPGGGATDMAATLPPSTVAQSPGPSTVAQSPGPPAVAQSPGPVVRDSTLSSSAGESLVRPRRRSVVPSAVVVALVSMVGGAALVYFGTDVFRRSTPQTPPSATPRAGPTPLAAPQVDQAVVVDAATVASATPDAATVASATPDATTDQLTARRDPPVKKSPRRAVRRTRPRVRPGRVTISVLSNGDPLAARVFLDGKPIGEAPIYRRALPPGTYRVEVREAGFRPEVRRIEVKPDEQLGVVLELRRR